MASGLLSGRMTRERALNLPVGDARRNSPEFQEPQITRNLALADKLREIGLRYGRSAAEIAVAWILRQPVVTGAIVGARSAAQIEGTIGAMDMHLTEVDMINLQQISAGLMETQRRARSKLRCHVE
jgi:aryl-alcohol dehydrogenase-like predicted oxidoreductase